MRLSGSSGRDCMQNRGISYQVCMERGARWKEKTHLRPMGLWAMRLAGRFVILLNNVTARAMSEPEHKKQKGGNLAPDRWIGGVAEYFLSYVWCCTAALQDRMQMLGCTPV